MLFPELLMNEMKSSEKNAPPVSGDLGQTSYRNTR